MTLPSQNQMIEAIRKEIGLDLTFMVKTLAGLWPTLKVQRPTNDDMLAGQLVMAQADDLLQPMGDDKPIRVFIVDQQLFIQLALMQDQRLDQSFGGFPVWATTLTDEELPAFLERLVHDRQDAMWQDAMKQAAPRFSFNVPTEQFPYLPTGKDWRTEADYDIERENRA